MLSAWALSGKGGVFTVDDGPVYGAGWDYPWLPVPTTGGPHHASVWLTVVPDGVTAVGWTFPGKAILAGVSGNVAAAPVMEAAYAVPEKVVWEGRRGQTLRTFVTGAPQPVLNADGIAGVRFGASPKAVATALSRLLGPPTEPLLPGGCGPIATIGWHALSAFFRDGRFVGYAYGTQTPQPLPGPLLATARGLTLGNTMAQAQSMYGASFRTSEEQGGAWFLGTGRSGLDGFAYTKTPLRHGDIGPQSTVATIQAGPPVCAALSP